MTGTQLHTVTLEFQTLGRFKVLHKRHDVTPTAPKPRQVLALLVLRANQVVAQEVIIDELWGNKPPNSAVTTTQTYIYHLRKFFAREIGQQATNQIIATSPPGYMFRLELGQLDSWKFDRMLDQARSHFLRDSFQESADLATRALSMWTGPALTNVTCGQIMDGHAAHLEEKRLAAVELRIEAEMALGRHRGLIGELKNLVANNPFHEWFHTQLIVALNRAGRRSEALASYHEVRRLLSSELGIDPSADLQRAHQEVLRAD